MIGRTIAQYRILERIGHLEEMADGVFARRFDELDAAPHKRMNRLFKQRIMSAAQDERINAALLKASEIGFHGQFHYGVIEPPLFDQRNKQRTWLAYDS